MSIKQIDEELGLWKARLNTAAQNLLDLQTHPIYKRVSAPEANLSGETAEQAAAAVRTLGYLLQCFDLLQGAIGRAEELRRDMPALFGADEREREIINVLQGKSIHLPSVQIPLQQRSLLTSIESVDAISPPELLAFMESAFDNVKQIVLRMDTAWESLGTSIEQAAQRLLTVRSKAEQLSAADRIDLENAAQRLKLLEQSAGQNPLGPALQTLASVNEVLVRIGGKLDQLEKERATAQHALAAARDLLTILKTGHETARAAYSEAREKAGYMLDFDSNDRKLQALLTWFDRLSSASAERDPASLLVGLKNWTNAAQQAITTDCDTLSRAKHLLAARSELRGRLDALKAKARAYSLAENSELVALADQATALLYQRPTPIDEAASLVSAYEAKLNSQARRSV